MTRAEEILKNDDPAHPVTCAFERAGAHGVTPGDPHSPGVVFVCAHGAGGTFADRGVTAVARELVGRGLDVVRFNFDYTERGSKRPDPMPKLESCFRSVLDFVRRRLEPRVVVIGGRSMGGRAASMIAAAGEPIDRLLLVAYPLHPPGRENELRAAHLSRITVPTLCLNGTRDDFCSPDRMAEILTQLPASFRMHWLEGADHGLHVLKKSGRTDADVLRELGETVTSWLG